MKAGRLGDRRGATKMRPRAERQNRLHSASRTVPRPPTRSRAIIRARARAGPNSRAAHPTASCDVGHVQNSPSGAKTRAASAAHLASASSPPSKLPSWAARCKAHRRPGLIARGHRNRELFYALDCRKHLPSAARPTGRTPGLHSRPPRLVNAAWKCSHAEADERSSSRILACAV
jgi:hypothetical protein